MSDVKIVEVEPQRVIGMRRRGFYPDMGEMFKELFTYVMKSQSVNIKAAPVFVCHETTEQEWKEAMEKGNADIEICIPISGDIDETEDYKVYELEGGTMAMTIHKGPYEECTPAYERLFKWIYENGYSVTGFTREVYISDPAVVPPEDLITQIYAPVGK